MPLRAVVPFVFRHPRHVKGTSVSNNPGVVLSALTVIDAQTGEAHQVADEAVDTGRSSGRYVAVCGTDVLAASLTTPAVKNCQSCAERLGR